MYTFYDIFLHNFPFRKFTILRRSEKALFLQKKARSICSRFLLLSQLISAQAFSYSCSVARLSSKSFTHLENNVGFVDNLRLASRILILQFLQSR